MRDRQTKIVGILTFLKTTISQMEHYLQVPLLNITDLIKNKNKNTKSLLSFTVLSKAEIHILQQPSSLSLLTLIIGLVK